MRFSLIVFDIDIAISHCGENRHMCLHITTMYWLFL